MGSAVIVVAGLSGAVPAQATSAPETTAGGTAPACIDRSGVSNKDGGGIHGYVYNHCGKTMRVKIVIHNWRDTSCESIPNGQGKFFNTFGGSYDRTAVC